MKRPVVTGIHVFRKYLERNPAEFHCPAGGDNDYFFVGECEKYPAGDLVENLPDCLTVSGLADRIRSFLHFLAPDEGPLADYETWMPDFMKGLASGIEKNRNLVEKAVRDVASDMVISPKVNGSEYGYADGALSGGSMSDLISGISFAVSEALAGFSSPQGNIVIPVYVGGTLLDELVVSAQARQNLRSGGR